jgi:hypothetical protein
MNIEKKRGQATFSGRKREKRAGRKKGLSFIFMCHCEVKKSQGVEGVRRKKSQGVEGVRRKKSQRGKGVRPHFSFTCHCEERSDEAISYNKLSSIINCYAEELRRFLHFARNDFGNPI